MQATQDNLVRATNKNDFAITCENELGENKRELLLRKGIYPYEYMDSWDCFEETQIPPID